MSSVHRSSHTHSGFGEFSSHLITSPRTNPQKAKPSVVSSGSEFGAQRSDRTTVFTTSSINGHNWSILFFYKQQPPCGSRLLFYCSQDSRRPRSRTPFWLLWYRRRHRPLLEALPFVRPVPTIHPKLCQTLRPLKIISSTWNRFQPCQKGSPPVLPMVRLCLWRPHPLVI